MGDRALTPHPQRFRRVLGHFATGVVIVTAIDQNNIRPTGLTVNSFTAVSLSPPLVSVCVSNTSTSWPIIRLAGWLGVNILGRRQRAICAQLAMGGDERFRDIEWRFSPGGSPVLPGAIAWLDGTVEAEHAAGDHVIVVVRVHHLDEQDDSAPLVFFRGEYGWFSSEPSVGRAAYG